MGSVTSYEEPCPACGKPSLFSDYYYRTGEGVYRCCECGYSRHDTLRRDESGKLIRRKMVYPISRVVLAEWDYETRKRIYEQPLTPELTKDAVYEMLNHPTHKGYRNLFEKSGVGDYTQLMYVGCDFELDWPNGAFVLHRAIMTPEYHYPRTDGVTIDIRPFTQEDINRLTAAGLDGAGLAESSYMVTACGKDGRTAERYVEQYMVEQAGCRYIAEHTELQMPEDRQCVLKLDFAPCYNSRERYPLRTIRVDLVQRKPVEVYRDAETGCHYLRKLTRGERIAEWMECGGPSDGFAAGDHIRSNVTFLHCGNTETTVWTQRHGYAVTGGLFNSVFHTVWPPEGDTDLPEMEVSTNGT